MVHKVSAIRKGFDYQARYFWIKLLELRGDNTKRVTFEQSGVPFMDDIVVEYAEPQLERTSGYSYTLDYHQCKYHVTYGGAFTGKNLINPVFIGCRESLLQRSYKAFLKLSNRSDSFRLIVVSNWSWDPHDVMSSHVSEQLIRDDFFAAGSKSSAGKMRREFEQHLGIGSDELVRFLRTIRFDLGKNLSTLTEELEPRLRLAGLKPIDHTKTGLIYDDLTYKWLDQRRNSFDKDAFDKIIKEEKLTEIDSPPHSEITIYSCAQWVRRPKEWQRSFLDLTDLFNGRFTKDARSWRSEIPNRIASFMRNPILRQLPPPIHLFLDCHLSIAFQAGYVLGPKSGLQIIPAQATRKSGFELWPMADGRKSSLWKVNGESFKASEEVVVGISVTNPIENHLLPYLESANLHKLPRLMLEPVGGCGPQAISNGDHAWYLGDELNTRFRSLLTPETHTMHLFFSVPVAFAYILGFNLRHITKTIQLYEHDFEGTSGGLRYSPSIRISAGSVSISAAKC